MNELSKEQIQKVIKTYIKDTLDDVDLWPHRCRQSDNPFCIFPIGVFVFRLYL